MNSFIADLKGRLPQSDWPLVVAALRNEPTLWAELNAGDFGAQALDVAGADRNLWCPAFLGLLRLNQLGQYEALRAETMEPVAEKLRYQAASAYEQITTGAAQQPAVTLEQATLLALALRERRRMLNTWEQLPEDLSIAPAEFWKLPVAILFGLTPNPQELIATLLDPAQAHELHELALHALVSNPLALDEQSSHLLEIIANYPLAQFLTILRSLSHMHLPLAQQAALQVLETLQAEPEAEASEMNQIERLLLQAEIRQISGQPGEAMPLLQDAWAAAQRVQSELASKLAETAAANGEGANSLATLPEGAAKGFAADRKHPAALISAARVALKSGDKEEAERMAKAALSAAQSSRAGENAPLMRQLGQLFVELKLAIEARQAAELAAGQAPNDAENAAFLSQVMALNNEGERALQAAHLAAALAPERSDLRRQLAQALQTNGQGAEAFAEWQAVMALEADPTLDDIFALAQAALAADEISACIQACQRVLTAQVTHGGAHALLGKALLAQGDASSAMEHLRRATELAPAQSEAWLALAEQQQAGGDLQAARDTLLNAQQFTKPAAGLQNLLGAIYLALQENEAALGAFSRAAELVAEASDSDLAQAIALQLGKLQRKLGHLNQARHTLERATQSYPANASLAHQYAKVLLAAEEPKPALAALEAALKLEPHNADLLLDAARAHLAAAAPAEAEACLHAALENEARSEGFALLGEALAAQGKYAEASKQFDAALKSELASDPAWAKRLALGKALAQAGSGAPTAAIRSLEEMERAQPGDLDVLRALCVAYSQAERSEEAFQIASKVYLSITKDEDGVLWFAEQAESLGKSDEARKALAKGVKELNSSAHVLRLAELEWEDGSHEKSVDTLAALLNGNDRAALAKAGRFLLGRRAAATSVSYFKRALEGGDDASLRDALTEAYEHSQQWNEALAVLEKSIAAEPNQPALLSRKARILQAAGRPQAALEILEQAIELLPEDLSLLANKARLLRAAGDWGAALTAAEKAFRLDVSSEELLQLAAELALGTLQPERARALLADAKLKAAPGIELACLQAELALDTNEELAAANALAPALEADENHPRVKALQSQLAARRGDFSQAERELQSGLEFVNAALGDPQDAFMLFSLARAAMRLTNFEAAVNLLQLAVKLAPGQALAQFNLGKAIVQRAEWQHLCAASDAVAGAPGEGATSKEAFAVAKAAFAAALSAAPFAAARAQLEHWLARAELRFSGKADLAALPKGYPGSAGEAAALLYAARTSGELKASEERSKAFWRAPEVLVERALAYQDVDAAGALKWVLGALEQKPHVAAYYALAARFAEQAGQAGAALDYIRQAIGLAPAQAAWLSFAGKLQQTAGSLNEAIDFFQHAVAMQPAEAERHFELGQAHMAAHQYSLAQTAFEQASGLQPKSGEYLLALAQACKESGELKLAAEKARAAHKLASKTNAALLLQAEIALEQNEAAEARSLAEAALRVSPRDAKALRLFAESLHAQGEVADAVAVLQRAEEAAEDKLPIQLRRAQLLPIEKGLEEMVRLSKANSERADVYQALSEMLATRGDLMDAIQAAQRAAKKASSLSRTDQARLHLHLGRLLNQSGQLDQSLHHLDEAAALAPHLPESQIERGRVFLARRQYKAAMDAFQQAAAIAPHSAQPHIEAALALKEAKDYDAAEVELRQAARLAPKDRSIQRQLAAVIALNLIHQPQEVGA